MNKSIFSRQHLINDHGLTLVRDLERDGTLVFEVVEGLEVVHISDLPVELVSELLQDEADEVDDDADDADDDDCNDDDADDDDDDADDDDDDADDDMDDDDDVNDDDGELDWP